MSKSSKREISSSEVGRTSYGEMKQAVGFAPARERGRCQTDRIPTSPCRSIGWVRRVMTVNVPVEPDGDAFSPFLSTKAFRGWHVSRHVARKDTFVFSAPPACNQMPWCSAPSPRAGH